MNERTGVGQKVIIHDSKGKILTIRRSGTAPTRALLWDLPGGDLEFGEDPVQGMLREIEEETGLVLIGPRLFDVSSHINTTGEFWVTLAYTLAYGTGEVRLSFEHDQFRWVTPDEFFELDSSPTLQHFVKKFVEIEGRT